MIDADSTDESVAWTSGKTLDAVEQPIRLRFHLRDSRLYSFQIN